MTAGTREEGLSGDKGKGDEEEEQGSYWNQ